MRLLLILCVLVHVSCSARRATVEPTNDRPPNVVIVFTDDLGYGDVGCYGAEGFETPHLDRMAEEGTRFTDFHVSQAVCSASRASLMTGCYSERVDILGALGPGARFGLNPDEETIADLLRARGYATGAFGKWHLGHHEPFLPLQQGFDEYFGLPYSNDMWPVDYDGNPSGKKSHYPALHLIDGNESSDEVATLADQARLTERYTRRAVDFIDRHADEPFFLYLAHSMPHVPLGAPLRFEGRSEQGAYGDVISEIDASVGRVLDALERHGLARDTLVVFTSDNGPWLNYGDHAGSTGGLREGKGTIWEGGARVPCIVRWPARVPAGRVCDRLCATIDLLPTIAAYTGAALPERKIDGVDVSALFEGRTDERPRRTLLYYYGRHLNGVRRDGWKLVLPHRYRSYEGVEPGNGGHPGKYGSLESGLELYDLDADPRERFDVASRRPEIVRELEALADEARAELGDRHRKVSGAGVRERGRLEPRRPSPVEHLAVGAAVALDREPHEKYVGAGAPGLVDGILGTEDFTDDRWLGFQGEDVEAIVDLGEPVKIRRVSCSFLQSQRSWIFLPRRVELAVSSDGVAFEPIGKHDRPVRRDGAERAETLISEFAERSARYVRVRATKLPSCPDWHSGAGEPAWIFVDEVVVE